jgi:Tfp pilus assembly protein PilF
MIFTPDRTPAGRGIQVRLSKGTNDFTAWTDQDGKFSIIGVGNGSYTLTAEAGDDFEPASERLEIAQARGAPPQTFYVNVQLRWKRNVTQKPGVIDAGMASVPEKALQHYRNARSLVAKGNHQGAVDELLKAVAEYPEFVLAHSELGVQFQKLNQLEKSDEHLRIALKLKPGAYEPLASLGVVLVRMKKHEEAESVLREALKIKDDSAVVHFYLGRSLFGQKKPSDAEPEFRAALSMGGNEMIEAYRSLANIYLQRGDDEKALSALEAYLAANPTPADVKQLRATVQQIKDSLKNRKP